VSLRAEGYVTVNSENSQGFCIVNGSSAAELIIDMSRANAAADAAGGGGGSHTAAIAAGASVGGAALILAVVGGLLLARSWRRRPQAPGSALVSGGGGFGSLSQASLPAVRQNRLLPPARLHGSNVSTHPL
jgi:hypothetical protein